MPSPATKNAFPQCTICGDPYSPVTRPGPSHTCSDWCNAVAWNRDPTFADNRYFAAHNEKRKMRRQAKQKARTVVCEICRKPFSPHPSQRNIRSHPGACRKELDRRRWERATQRKRARRNGEEESSHP